MKKIYSSIIAIAISLIAIPFAGKIQAQTFHKGSFLIGLSEGSTVSDYETVGPGHQLIHKHMDGARDPLTLEYGLSKSWGIGISLGGDIFEINPATFYETDIQNKDTKAITSEFTIDGSYHFFVSRKTDFSIVGSLGNMNVTIQGSSNDQSYQYVANGHISRLALRAKYYFWKRFGVHAIWSMYSSSASPKDVKENTFGNLTSTSIKGRAFEFGLCFRIGKLNCK